MTYDYNNSYHRSINMTPTEGSLKTNSKTVYKNLFPKLEAKKSKPKFNIGDRVRISKKQRDFHEGYVPNITEENFVVTEIQKTGPITFKLEDLNNEKIIVFFMKRKW